eukprot:s303_g3.t1
MVRRSGRVRQRPAFSAAGPIAAPSPVQRRHVQRSIRRLAMFVHALHCSLLLQPFLPVAIFTPQSSVSIVAAMLHAVRTEQDVDKLVMRLILLNAPKARVCKNICFLSIRSRSTFSLQAFVWVVIMMCYHANMPDVAEAGKGTGDGRTPVKSMPWTADAFIKHSVWLARSYPVAFGLKVQGLLPRLIASNSGQPKIPCPPPNTDGWDVPLLFQRMDFDKSSWTEARLLEVARSCSSGGYGCQTCRCCVAAATTADQRAAWGSEHRAFAEVAAGGVDWLEAKEEKAHDEEPAASLPVTSADHEVRRLQSNLLWPQKLNRKLSTMALLVLRPPACQPQKEEDPGTVLDVSSDESDSETAAIRRAPTLQLGQTDDLPQRSSCPVLTAAERAEIATWPDSHPRGDAFGHLSKQSTPESATPATAASPMPEQKLMTAVKAQPPKAPATTSARDLEFEEMQKKYADLQAQLALLQTALQKKEKPSFSYHSPPVQKPVFTPEASSTSLPKMASPAGASAKRAAVPLPAEAVVTTEPKAAATCPVPAAPLSVPATPAGAVPLPKAAAAAHGSSTTVPGKVPEPKAAAPAGPASISDRSIEVPTPPPVPAGARSARGSPGAGADMSEEELTEFYSLDAEAEFATQLVKIKEVSRAREEEIEGGWYTEERMEKDLGYSKMLGAGQAYAVFAAACFFLVLTLVAQDTCDEGEGRLRTLQNRPGEAREGSVCSLLKGQNCSASFCALAFVSRTGLQGLSDMPDKLEHKPLMDQMPSEPKLPDGALGSVPLDGMAEIKDNLKQFTEATHCKASQVVTCVKILAAEHRYKLLAGELKKPQGKRPREEGNNGQAPAPEAEADGNAPKKPRAKAKAKAKAS